MSSLALETKSRWAAACGGAGVVLLATVALAYFTDVSAPGEPGTAATPAPAMAITRVSTDALRDETVMTNWAPLFLPTEYNARLPELPLRASSATFLDSDPVKLHYPDAAPNFAAKLSPLATLNGKRMGEVEPLDSRATETMIPLALGFGRAEKAVTPIPPRGGVLEVVASSSGEKVLAVALPAGARPPTEQPWQPIEFAALVNRAGLVGPLEVTASSRVEAVDNYFKNYLVQTFRIGDRLAPGFYRITLGP